MSTLRFAVLLAAVALVACDDEGTGSLPSAPAEASVQITPNPVEVRVGDIVALRVENLALNEVPAWTSENPLIAVVTAPGFVRGLMPGVTFITATVGSREGKAMVVVAARPPLL